MGFKLVAKSNFQKGGDSPPGIEANPHPPSRRYGATRVRPTILEITFGKRYKLRSHPFKEGVRKEV